MSASDIIKSTIMFTDIVGYSAMTSKNQEHSLDLLSTHDNIIEPIIRKNGGSVIKKIGDSIFAEFPSPKASVNSAQEVQAQLKKRNSISNIDDQIQIRIGLHTGDVIRKDDDLFGHDVNLCSRIESISPRGGIAASIDLIELIENDFPFREMGYVKLKNIVQPQKIYKIYLSQDDYLEESEKQLQQSLHDNGIEILDMDSYNIIETFSTAVLYVKNLGAGEDESIAYGLTEGLINDFTYINNFRTPTFNETLQYKNTELGRDDIGRKLQVDNILHGNILKDKNKLKLSFELLDINLGKVLWSETWSDHLSNSNNIRNHILNKILSHFQIEMPKQLSDVLSDEMTTSSDALEAYYNGKYCSDYLKSKEDLENGTIMLKKAFELDNNFVEAYYLYGISCHRLGNYDAAESALTKGQEIAEKKNNLQGLAFIYKGFSTIYADSGKFEKSKHSIEKALKIQIQLNNQTVEAMLRLDYASALNHLSEIELSIEQNKQSSKLLKSIEDDRLFAISSIILINSYIILGDYTKSIEYGKLSLGLCRRLGMTNYLGRALIMMGEALNRTGYYEDMKTILNEAEPIWITFDDAFMNAKINYLYAQYFLSKKDFTSTLSYIDESIELYNLAEHTQFETQALIEKLNIVIECGKMDLTSRIISKIDRLINKLKGTYSNDLFTAMKYYIDSKNEKLDLDNLNEFYNLLEDTDTNFLNYPLAYWYLAQAYHSINQQNNANACHEKAKQIIDYLADRISGKKDKTTFYTVYFYNRIQEDLV